jgi:hypothetical protein
MLPVYGLAVSVTYHVPAAASKKERTADGSHVLLYLGGGRFFVVNPLH